MRVVLLVNMGSPHDKKSMKTFLKKMFLDKAILPLPFILRVVIAFIISKIRHKNSWAKYEKIGGSPLKKSMNNIKNELQKNIDSTTKISIAYSYSEPYFSDEIKRFYKSGIKDFIVIPMYPQSSFTTKGSLQNDINKIKCNDINIKLVNEFCENKLFFEFWISLINQKIAELNYKKPYLLFSAHSIPQYNIEKGDTYSQKINFNAEKISSELNLPYSVCYQSKLGKIKWTEPDILSHLNELKNKNIDEIIIIPISFISENLETLYDLDLEIIPYAKQKIGINNIGRINIPLKNEVIIKMFNEIIIL